MEQKIHQKSDVSELSLEEKRSESGFCGLCGNPIIKNPLVDYCEGCREEKMLATKEDRTAYGWGG